MELKDVLVFLSTTGAAVLAYWLMENLAFMSLLDPVAKRWTAFGLTSVIAVLAWLAQVAMLYQLAPADWRAWVEAVSAVAFAAVGVNQLIHAQASMGRGTTT